MEDLTCLLATVRTLKIIQRKASFEELEYLSFNNLTTEAGWDKTLDLTDLRDKTTITTSNQPTSMT